MVSSVLYHFFGIILSFFCRIPLSVVSSVKPVACDWETVQQCALLPRAVSRMLELQVQGNSMQQPSLLVEMWLMCSAATLGFLP